MNKNRIFKYSATLGFIGFLPAPGTMGTLVTLPVIYFLHSDLWYTLLMLLTCALAYFIIKKALPFFNEHDPAPIIVDEVAGVLVAFWHLPMAMTWHVLLAGFILFRFFDISKMSFIDNFSRRTGAWAVLADDLMAGLVTNIVLKIGYVTYLKVMQ